MLNEVIGHTEVKVKLKSLIKNIPKVLLFSGPEGVGKKFTAFRFINEINNGYLTDKYFTHPDIYFLKPDTNTFKLDLVDKLKENVSTKPFELSQKYFILDDIHLMNKESSNACLKIFEDCPDHCIFILLAEDSSKVLDTILSRSLKIEFNPIPNLKDYYPNLTDLQLDLMGGCLGRRELVLDKNITGTYNEVLQFVKNINNKNYNDIIDWCLNKRDVDINYLTDLILVSLKDISKDPEKTFLADVVLNEVKNFKSKLTYSVNLQNHFRYALISARRNLQIFN